MNELKPFEIFIRYNVITNNYDFYFIYNNGEERKIAQPVEFVFTSIKKGSQPLPTFSLDTFMTKMFLQSIAKELENLDIKKPNEHKLEGILEATKYHLEDMRRLVFKEEKELVKKK